MRDDERRLHTYEPVPALPAGLPVTGPGPAPLILLLQGPVGPFFAHLGRAFERQGCTVLKINFSGGDWLFHRGRSVRNFIGSTSAWQAWLTAFIARSRPAAIVLFGDGRPYHRAASAVAARAGVPVWCLEEGYARPNFVTCEEGGNNAGSPLRQAGGVRLECAPVELPHIPVTGDLFAAMAVHAVAHAVAKAFGRPYFRGNEAHRNRGLWSEGWLWSRGFVRKIVGYHANHSLLQQLIEHREGRYVVVALQVHDDLHLLRNGHGWTMDTLIGEAIRSFACHAEPSLHLVFKVHPMDRGHRSYRRLVHRIAQGCGCQSRVHVIDDGSIGLMIRHARGVVTVNSTSGLLALNHGKPLLALGEAIYTGAGLTLDATDGPEALDRFWHIRTGPEPQRVAQFMQRMRRESQVNGSFYLRHWLGPTSEQIAARIMRALDPSPSHRREAEMTVPTPGEVPR